MGALLENSTRLSGGESPATLASLLRILHAESQSALRQQQVLWRWLDGHDPSKSLRISMRANGYGMLVNALDAKRGYD